MTPDRRTPRLVAFDMFAEGALDDAVTTRLTPRSSRRAASPRESDA